jgi:hypothetical protein
LGCRGISEFAKIRDKWRCAAFLPPVRSRGAWSAQRDFVVTVQQIWQSIVLSLGGYVVVLGAITWLAMRLVTKVMDRDSARAIEQLKTENARTIEQAKADLQLRAETFKSDLQRLASEHSIRFQRLHSERAEVIKNLYGKLAKLDSLLQSTLRPFQASGEPSLTEKVGQLIGAHNDALEYFTPRRIFFEEPLAQLVDSALDVSKNRRGHHNG